MEENIVVNSEPMEIDALDAPPELPPGTCALDVIELPELLAEELARAWNPLIGHLPTLRQILSLIAHDKTDCYLKYGPGAPSWIRMPDHPIVLPNIAAHPTTDEHGHRQQLSKQALVDMEVVRCDAQSPSHREWRGYQSDFLDVDDIIVTALVFVNHINVVTPTVELRKHNRRLQAINVLRGFSFQSSFNSTARAITPEVHITARAIATEGHTVIVPASAEYRVGDVELIDPAKPSSFSIIRVALIKPGSERAEGSLTSENLVVHHWPGEARLVATYWNKSPEEERLTHCTQEGIFLSEQSVMGQDLAMSEWPPVVFRRVAQHGNLAHPAHLTTLQLISELSNSPEWWVVDQATRQARVATTQELYLHWRLRIGVPRALDLVSLEIRSDKTAQAHPATSDTGAQAHGSAEALIGQQDELAVLLAQMGILKVMHDRIFGTPVTSHLPLEPPVSSDELLRLLQAYRAAQSTESKADVLRQYFGEEYPVQRLQARLDTAVEDVEFNLAEWSKWLLGAVDATHSTTDDALFSPVVDVFVRDEFLSLSLRKSLSVQLKPLRQRHVRCLLSPIGIQPLFLPTFSVPRCGSVQQRMEATIGLPTEDQPPVVGPQSGGFFTATPDHAKTMVPSDVFVDSSGNVKFLSYIRNLHPRQHRDLYQTLEATVSAMVPLFETSLESLLRLAPEESRYWTDAGQLLSSPTVASPAFGRSTGIFSLRGRVLQLIVEIVEIELTDEIRLFGGDNWHSHRNAAVFPIVTPSSQNQNPHHLVASVVCFAEVDNITKPCMLFRPSPLHDIGGPFSAHQTLAGFVTALTGRCVAYPSEYEYKLMPFERVDTSKRGILRMVKFHLMNPFLPVVSTASLYPQHREWIIDATVGLVTRQFNLPAEVRDEIAAMLPWSGQMMSDSSWFARWGLVRVGLT